MEVLLEIAGRTAAVYVFLLGCILLFGKKELSQLSVIDLIFILLLSNSVQNAMVGPSTSLDGGLVSALVLFLLNFTFKSFLFKNKALQKIMEGSPVLLINHGEFVEANMQHQKITTDEIMSSIREHGVNAIGEVKFAILEPDGNISVISYEHGRHTIHHRRKVKPVLNQ
ncbi:DUF421 domain-containing protein [Bacteroidota bacterium]|nr:DUF421 domain-containing protein [Bacteroidota bacterium]